MGFFTIYHLLSIVKCLNLNMKKIIIKEIDKYSSKLYKNKSISEYLIYIEINGVRLHAYTELGEDSKKERVNELILEHFITDETNKINKDEIIEEFSLDQILNKKQYEQ